MNFHGFKAVVCLVILAATTLSARPAFAATLTTGQSASSATSILVRFRPAAGAQDIAALNAAQGTREIDAIPQVGVHVLGIPAGASATAVAASFKKSPAVQFAEPNELVKPETTPNDPLYPLQWHLPAIDAPGAWSLASATNVLVGICDTGVDPTHPDLVNVLRADLGWNSADNSTNWSDVMGHGTMMAGTVAAQANNSIGVSGVAWGAQIIPVRISDSTDGSALESDAAKCITYAADHGARAINLSYDMAGSATIDSAGTYAQGEGALTFVAAGNDATNPGWPNYPGFLAVSATNGTDTLASFSNYGSFVDLAAPGVYIESTTWDGAYGAKSGTSFSSPIAAAVAALVFGANPSLTAAQVQNILLTSSDPVGGAGWNQYFGYGRVNAAKAVAAALGVTGPDASPPAVVVTAPFGGSTVTGLQVATAVATDDVGVTRVELDIDGAFATASTSSPVSYFWNTATVPNGNHVLVAKAYDAAGNVGTSLPVTINVQSTDTTPPTVSITSPTGGATVSGSVSVGVSATDNVSVSQVQFYVDGTLQGSTTTSPYAFTWNTSALSNGSHSLVATATDPSGNVGTSATVTVNVQNADTTPPVVSITSPAGGTTVSGSVNVAANASDNVGVVKVELYVDSALQGSTTTSPYAFAWATTSVANGSHNLVAKAYDAAGNVGTSATVTVNVQNTDTTPPTVAITSPAGGATVSGTVTVSASASDNVGVTQVAFYVDGVLKITDMAAPYTYGWDTTTVANGSHSLVAKAYDAAGNVGTSATVTVNVQNPVAPAGPTTSTFTGSVGGKSPSSQSFTVNVGAAGAFTASLSCGGKANLQMVVYAPDGSVAATGTTSISFTAAAGAYQVVVTAISGKANFTLTVTHF